MENLKKLLEGLLFDLISGKSDVEISQTCVDSRKAKKGSLFFALLGQSKDGAEYIDDAINRGAACVITDSPEIRQKASRLKIPQGFPVISCANARELMGQIHRRFYSDPSSQMDVVGITGTNGKTTAVYLLEHILKANKQNPGVISTIRYSFGNRSIPAEMTTPDSPDLFDLLSQMVKSGCDVAVMEVSSQAASQKRISGVRFKLKAFTNLSQDHLDYHRTIEEYGQAKESFLFSRENIPVVLNIDDSFGKKMHEAHRSHVESVTYSVRSEADFQAVIERDGFLQGSFIVKTSEGEAEVQTKLQGIFNVYNILAGLAAASLLGVELNKAIEAVRTFSPPQGRLSEVACWSGNVIYVDYAHTPDALKSVLETLKSRHPRQLSVCFGCGGERDKEKREKMGRIAAEMADAIFITNDNPRREDPDAIITDILRGADSQKTVVEKDRRKAIARAIESMKENDILLVAGKGHENYQITGSQYIPFNDMEVVTQICREIEKKTTN